MTTTTPSPPDEAPVEIERDFENEGEDTIKDLPEIPPARPRISRFHSSPDIRTSGINFGIPTSKSALAFATGKHGEEHNKARILKFLHKKVVQWILLGLLSLDVLVIFAELFLHAEFPSCRLVERDCLACCESGGDGHGNGNGNVDNGGGRFLRWLAETSHGDGHHEGVCEAGYEDIGVAGCDPHKYDSVHKVENFLFYVTVFILCTFFIEISLEIVALGPCKFFSQVFLALDFFVVTISLVAELTLHFLHDVVAEITGVLILFRLWRFVRIGHGIMEVTSDLTHDIYDPLKEHVKKCEERLREHGMACPERCKQVGHLMHEDH